MEEAGTARKAAIAKWYRHKDNDLSHLSAFQAFRPSYWAERREVSSDPMTNAIAKARANVPH